MSAADEAKCRTRWPSAASRTTTFPREPTPCLISTCTVRQHAEDRALSLIGSLRPWKEADPSRVLIVSGCAAERLDGWIQKRFPYVDLVVGAKSIDRSTRWCPKRSANASTPSKKARGLRLDAHRLHGDGLRDDHARLQLFCSYCIVPAVRGRELYRPVEDVLADVARKVAGGAREVMLLARP